MDEAAFGAREDQGGLSNKVEVLMRAIKKCGKNLLPRLRICDLEGNKYL
jgi:hypothetical protein